MPIKKNVRRRKHWTSTIEGRKRQSKLQKDRWARHRASKAQMQEALTATDGVGQDMESLRIITEAMKNLSPAGMKYLKQSLTP